MTDWLNFLEGLLGPSEKYVVGSFGAAGLVIGAAEWICSGGSLDGMPRQLGLSLAWFGLVLVQLLTLYALKRRLNALGQSTQWVWSIVVLWVSFDALLIARRHTYIFLPLLYGAAQAVFLFAPDRKADQTRENSAPSADE